MIELRNVNKAFGDNKIFTNFNCVIEEGEFIGIKGVSGSGKSTLLNMMGLLEKCDSGRIIINRNIICFDDKKQLNELRKTKIGYLFQNFALIDDFSVFENLAIGLPIRSKSDQAEQITRVLKQLNLDVDLKQKIFKLSGGEQQRVAIARLILQKKSIVLADEPTASVDPNNRDIILANLKELNRKGITIVVVSHDDYVIKQTNRVIEL